MSTSGSSSPSNPAVRISASSSGLLESPVKRAVAWHSKVIFIAAPRKPEQATMTRPQSQPARLGLSPDRRPAEIPRRRAQLVLDAQQLVVFRQPVGAGERTRLDLPAVGGHREVRNR